MAVRRRMPARLGVAKPPACGRDLHAAGLNFSAGIMRSWLAVETHMSSPEGRFLEKMGNKEQYSGRWIAILDAQIIASGGNIADVYANAAKSAKGRTPLFVQIPDKNREQPLIL